MHPLTWAQAPTQARHVAATQAAPCGDAPFARDVHTQADIEPAPAPTAWPPGRLRHCPSYGADVQSKVPHGVSPPTAPQDSTWQKRVFVAVQRRHLAPGTLHRSILTDALALSAWQAQNIFDCVTQGMHKPYQRPRLPLWSEPQLRACLFGDMREHAPRIGALLMLLDDARDARQSLFVKLCDVRRHLCQARRLARQRGGAQSDDMARIARLEAALLCISHATYAYPFVGLGHADCITTASQKDDASRALAG